MIDLEKLKEMGAFTLYSVKEISEILNIEERTIRNWIRRGLKVNATVGCRSHILGKDLAEYWERFVTKTPKKQKIPQELVDKARAMMKEILATRPHLPRRPYKEIAEKLDILLSEAEYMTKDMFPPREKIKYKDYVNTYNIPVVERIALKKLKLKYPDIVKHLGIYFYSPKAYGLIKSRKQPQNHMR